MRTTTTPRGGGASSPRTAVRAAERGEDRVLSGTTGESIVPHGEAGDAVDGFPSSGRPGASPSKRHSMGSDVTVGTNALSTAAVSKRSMSEIRTGSGARLQPEGTGEPNGTTTRHRHSLTLNGYRA